jgi:hypothetical protein
MILQPDSDKADFPEQRHLGLDCGNFPGVTN